VIRTTAWTVAWPNGSSWYCEGWRKGVI